MTHNRTRPAARLAVGATLVALLAPVGAALPDAVAATCNAPTPDGAVLTLDDSAPVSPGQELHLSGTGFTPGQRLAIKIDRDLYGQLGADTAEEVPEAIRERIEVGPDGSFSGEHLRVPRYQLDGKATEAGAHTINLLDNDPVTTVCATFTTAPAHTYAADTTSAAAPGDSVTVSGTGWLDRAGTGSSTVGVVIEEAGSDAIVATEHVAGHRPHANPRIWAIVPAEAFTAPGTFRFDVALPDGTTSGAGGSTTAFGGRSYRVRLWSGQQLQRADDITRNAVVGEAFDISVPADQPAVKATKKPAISGKAKVGNKLKVSKGTWSTSVKVTYQWLGGNKAIKGATKAKYKATKADAGKKLKVKVTATKAGWKSATVTTKAVKVKK